jgi:hypothetical protein
MENFNRFKLNRLQLPAEVSVRDEINLHLAAARDYRRDQLP